MELNRPNKSNDFFGLLIKICVLFVIASIFLYPETTNVFLKQGSRIAFIVLILISSFTSRLRVNTSYFIWALLFSGLCLINCLFAKYRAPAVTNLITVIQAVWVAFFFVIWLSERGEYRWLFNSIIGCSVIYCIRIVLYIGTINWGIRKVGFILGTNVNSIGFRLAVACLFCLYLFYKRTIKHNYLYVILSLLFVVFILITGSRRALILIIIAYVVFSLSQAQNFAKRFKAYIWIVFIILAIYLLVTKIPQLYAIIGSRIQNTISALFSSETVLDNGRDEMISTGLRLFLQKPLFGWGMNNFRYVSGIDHAYSHNNFVELLFAMGFPAFLVYYSIVPLCLKARKVFMKKSLEYVLCFTSLAYCLIADLAAANYTSLLSHLLYAIPISLYLYKIKQQEQEYNVRM